MENLQLSNKQNITLKWSKIMQTNLEVDSKTNKVVKCFTTNKTSKKTIESTISKCAAQKLFNGIQTQKQFIIMQSQYTISSDMTRISLNDNQKLLGGGCVSSNHLENRFANKKQNSKIEITHLDEIHSSDDFLIELTKESSIDLEGEIFPYFKSILKNQNPDLSSFKMLQKIFMYCIEYILLDNITNYNHENNQILNNNIRQGSIEKLKKYIKKFQNYFNSNKNQYPLESNLIILEWLNCILKFDKKDKLFLAKSCTEQDCLIFSSNLETSPRKSIHQKSVSFIIEGDDLIDNYTMLFKQKNPIFHLIGYRRIICSNYASCMKNLPNLMDRLFFSHHKSINRFKSNMSFDVKFYSLFLINLLLQQYKDSAKPQSVQNNASIYTNTFFFSKNEGIIVICQEEFKLQQNDNTNESVKTFLSHHQSLRFISSEILRNCFQFIIKQLPQTVYYNEQKNEIYELIKYRTTIERSESVKIVFSQDSCSSMNTLPSPSHTQINLVIS